MLAIIIVSWNNNGLNKNNNKSKVKDNSDKNINIDMMSSTYSDHGYNKNIKPSFHF